MSYAIIPESPNAAIAPQKTAQKHCLLELVLRISKDFRMF